MPVYKATVFFAFKRAGWSETYYRTNDNIQLAQQELAALVNSRSLFLAQPCEIISARISDVNMERDSLPASLGELVYFNDTYRTDVPWNAILYRLYATALYQRPLYVRGIPDIMFTQNTPSATEKTWQTNWRLAATGFLNGLIANQWQIRAQAKGVLAPLYGIDSIVIGAAPNSLHLHLTSAFALSVNQIVTVYARGFSPPIRKQQILAVDNTARTIDITYDGVMPTNTARNGGVKLYGLTYQVIDKYVEEGFTHRIVGRPFGQQVGRRPRRP